MKMYVKSRLVSAPPKYFKFNPIRKRFHDSESALISDQKCTPNYFPNP